MEILNAYLQFLGLGRELLNMLFWLRPKFEKAYPLSEAIADGNPVLEDLKSALLNLNYPSSQVNDVLEEMKRKQKNLGTMNC